MLSKAAKFAGLCEGSASAPLTEEAACACNLPREEKPSSRRLVLGAVGYRLAAALAFKAIRRVLEAGRYVWARGRQDVLQEPQTRETREQVVRRWRRSPRLWRRSKKDRSMRRHDSLVCPLRLSWSCRRVCPSRHRQVYGCGVVRPKRRDDRRLGNGTMYRRAGTPVRPRA
jgi:hypothetical protein